MALLWVSKYRSMIDHKKIKKILTKVTVTFPVVSTEIRLFCLEYYYILCLNVIENQRKKH